MTTDAGHFILSHLSFLAESAEWRTFADLLCEPLEFRNCRLSPVDTPIEVLLERIDHRLIAYPELRNLFYLALLSAYLRFPGECPPAVDAFLSEHNIQAALLPGLNLTNLSAVKWTAAAVMATLGQEALIRYFVVGKDAVADGLVHLPPWAEPLLDETAKQAIGDAAQAAARVSKSLQPAGFCCFPLCVPNGSVQIRGRSLGLALGLAFAGLLNGGEPRRVIAATGDLGADGKVRKVGGLDLKSACLIAHPRKSKALLFPAENKPPCLCEGLELLPVSNLQEALMFSALHTSGRADLLIQLPYMLKDHHRFVDGCRTLSPTWIRWAVARGELAGVAEGIAASQEVFDRLLARLEESLKLRDFDLSSAIAGVIGPNHFNSVAKSVPLAAFKWCTQNIALANHTGDIVGAAGWIRKSDSLMVQISQVDSEAVADHYNHRLVSDHNRYRFVPEVPSELEGCLSLLENQLDVKMRAGIQGYMTLGRLYGTLGQHFAFCGPCHVETALDYFKKARSTLGEGTVSDLKPEWKRQLNYEAFAYLNASKFDEARQHVCAYLEVLDLNEVRPEAITLEPPWKHNLLARFLADTGDGQLCRRYLAWAEQRSFAPREVGHPWQLWTFNVGRIAFAMGDTEAAATSFKISLGLCLEALPTIKVMALLGLSGLAKIDSLPENLSEIESDVRRAAAELNPDHFADVLKVPFEEVLEQVWLEPGRLFPFSYH